MKFNIVLDLQAFQISVKYSFNEKSFNKITTVNICYYSAFIDRLQFERYRYIKLI